MIPNNTYRVTLVRFAGPQSENYVSAPNPEIATMLALHGIRGHFKEVMIEKVNPL